MNTPTLSQLFPYTQSYEECDPLYSVPRADTIDTIVLIADNVPTYPTATAQVPTVQVLTSDDGTSHVINNQPRVVDRPQRARQLPAKFTEFTSLPTNLVDKIQLKSTSSTLCVSLTDYLSGFSLVSIPTHFVASTTSISAPTTYKQAVKHSN